MRKKLLWGVVVLVVVAAVGAGVVKSKAPKPTPIQPAKVAREDLQAKVTGNGKIQAKKKVDISATIMGQVTHLAVREGDTVTKGQFLLEIDSANPRAAARSTEFSMQAMLKEVDSAKANLEFARSDFRRADENYKAKIISASDYQRARTALDTAEAQVRAAEQRVEMQRATLDGARDTLARTVVRAPIDGVVTARRIEEGEVAVIGIQNSPGTVLLTISDMSVVEAEMEIDETSIPQVKVGEDARIRIDAYQNRTFDGVVTEVGSSPILKTGDLAIKFLVKVQLKNPPEGIKPGLSCQADVLTGFRPQALAVPIQALVVRDIERKPGEKPVPGAPRDEEGVYIVESGKVRFQKIKTGLTGELSIEVLEGLKGGEEIVKGPFKTLRTLKPGDAVKPEEEGAPGAPKA